MEEGDGHGGPDSERRTPFPRVMQHTVEHVLTECLFTALHRATYLRNNSIHHIFSTEAEAGGEALCHFLHFHQLLLCPFPPRPDPP